jgi:hypothetical protein
VPFTLDRPYHDPKGHEPTHLKPKHNGERATPDGRNITYSRRTLYLSILVDRDGARLVEDLGSTSRTNLLHAIEQREEEEASRVLASLCDRRDGDGHRRGLLSPLIDMRPACFRPVLLQLNKENTVFLLRGYVLLGEMQSSYICSRSTELACNHRENDANMT